MAPGLPNPRGDETFRLKDTFGNSAKMDVCVADLKKYIDGDRTLNANGVRNAKYLFQHLYLW